jgi:EAL domain-containing protein (putative c-di-GMP-specific phosphodiesterase class I)
MGNTNRSGRGNAESNALQEPHQDEQLFARHYRAGSVVFFEGEPGDCAYVIERGQIEISGYLEGEKIVLGQLGPGEMFGEMALIDDTVRSATALAVEDTDLTVVMREQLRARVDRAEPILRLLLSVILERFRKEQNLFRYKLPAERQAENSNAESDIKRSAIEKIKLENELRRALEHDELELYYQPIVNLQTASIAGFEALIRWHHPERGLIPPSRFVGLAEETPLIVPVGNWVLDKATQSLLELTESMEGTTVETSPLMMSINISGKQFADGRFFDTLADVIQKTRVHPRRLMLEITEGVLMRYQSALNWIEQCRELGVRIALDDFGAGYSSLGYLNFFPIDVLKMDRSFISELCNDRSRQIARAIVDLAHGIGLEVVAEGIEEPEQKHDLTAMSCEYGQGYLFSRPVPLSQAVQLLHKYSCATLSPIP